MGKIIEIDEQYREWISDVSKRFRQSQIKAVVKVNDEMFRFYWQLGKELHSRNLQSFIVNLQIFLNLGKISEVEKSTRFLQFHGDTISSLWTSVVGIRKRHYSL